MITKIADKVDVAAVVVVDRDPQNYSIADADCNLKPFVCHTILGCISRLKCSTM